MVVGCPFPSGGGPEKSLPLKTAAVSSEQADSTYLLRVMNLVALKRALLIEDLSEQSKADLTNLL